MVKYKHTYTGSGIMTFYDKKGIGHIVAKEHPSLKDFVILEEKIDTLGIKVEKIGKEED